MPNQLSLKEQIELFKRRGIKFLDSNNETNIKKIQEIGYYRLKELAKPYNTSNNKKINYRNLTFNKLIDRYYNDKDLRIYVLHAIEDIEISIANSISSLLGDKYGAYGYLQFKLWFNRRESKFKVEEKQYKFKKRLLKKVKKSTLEDLKGNRNKNKDGFPTIWLMVNLLTFGNLANIISDMSLRNKRTIANRYNCTVNELVNWLHCLNLIRNICAHNSNLIDVKLKTKPIPPHKFKSYITLYKQHYSNSLAMILFIIKFLMDNINNDYHFDKIYNTVKKIAEDDDNLYNRLGFVDNNALNQILNKKDDPI